MSVDLSRQKELDADPKAIQKIELVGQLKNPEYFEYIHVFLNNFRKN